MSDSTLELCFPIPSDSNYYNEGEPGSCYGAAFSVLMACHDNRADFTPPIVDMRVVHGVVTCSDSGNDDPMAGQRIIHAWVELTYDMQDMLGLDEPCPMQLVLDASAVGRPITILPVDTYYSFGKVNSANLRRYSKDALIALLEHHLHFGPFHRPLEPCIGWDAADDIQCDPITGELNAKCFQCGVANRFTPRAMLVLTEDDGTFFDVAELGRDGKRYKPSLNAQQLQTVLCETFGILTAAFPLVSFSLQEIEGELFLFEVATHVCETTGV